MAASQDGSRCQTLGVTAAAVPPAGMPSVMGRDRPRTGRQEQRTRCYGRVQRRQVISRMHVRFSTATGWSVG